MKLHSDSFTHEGKIPEQLAFCRPDPDTRVTLGGNTNPHLAWSEVPDAVRSFVVLCVDPDVPTVADDINQEDREVPADLVRTDFYHLFLVALPSVTREVDEGSYSIVFTSPVKAG